MRLVSCSLVRCLFAAHAAWSADWSLIRIQAEGCKGRYRRDLRGRPRALGQGSFDGEHLKFPAPRRPQEVLLPQAGGLAPGLLGSHRPAWLQDSAYLFPAFGPDQPVPGAANSG